MEECCWSRINISPASVKSTSTFETSVTDEPNALISLTLFMNNLNKRKYIRKGQQTNCSNKAIPVPIPNLCKLRARLGWAGLDLRQGQAKFLILSRLTSC